MVNPLPDTVQKAVDLAVKMLAPHRIILFGSRARGDARPDSDFDFCLELDSKSKPDQWTRFCLDVKERPLTLFSMDWLLWDEMSERYREAVKKEGRVLYEKKS